MRTIANLQAGLHSLPVAIWLQRYGLEMSAVIAPQSSYSTHSSLVKAEFYNTRLLDRDEAKRACHQSNELLKGFGPVDSPWNLLGDPMFVLGLAMLDRSNWNSANFTDLYRLYTRHIEWARNLLRETKAELCFFDGLPHQSQDWALYQACKESGVRTLIPQHVAFDHSKILQSDLAEGPLPIRQLAPDAITAGNSESDYLENKVTQLTKTSRSHTQRGFRQILRSLSVQSVLSKFRWFQPVHYAYTTLIPSWRHTEISQDLVRLRDRYRQSRVSRWLLELPQGPPSGNAPVVYFPLHFQPEATSLPQGLAYFDQISAIRAVAGRLPQGAILVIKEHPQMLKWHKQWARARSDAFYEEIQSIPNTMMVSPSTPSDLLMERACLVATLTGTPGYEARQLGKSALIFGSTWYENFQGVYKARAEGDIEKAIAKGMAGADPAPTADDIEAFRRDYTMIGFGRNIPRPEGAPEDFWAKKFAYGLAEVARSLYSKN